MAVSYLPSLLDRLQDDNPSATAEYSGHQAITIDDYRRIVKRDLERLLNHDAYFNRPAEHDPARRPPVSGEDYPLVAESVLNYGLEIPAGIIFTADIVRQVKKNIQEAIECFEPRVTKVLVEKELDPAAGTNASLPGKYSIVIVTELIAEPFPERLNLRTELDLISGRCERPESAVR